MAASSRRKGVEAEAEVRHIWQAAGFEVRGLEGQGDHLVIRADGLVIHSEVKRQERIKIREWLYQAKVEAPAGTLPVVQFRWNHGEWYAALPLASLMEVLS